MAFDPENPGSLKKLIDAADYSRRQLSHFLDTRLAFVREFVGKHYGENGADDKVPINMLDLASNTYTTYLAPENPQGLVTTKYKHLKPFATKMTQALRECAHEVKLAAAIESAVLDSLFLFGAVKVGHDGISAAHTGYDKYVKTVDPQDWVHDWSAHSLEEAQFMGDRFRMDLDEARNNPAFDQKQREKIQPLDTYVYDEDGTERIEELGSNDGGWISEQFRDKAELWSVWLPREQIVIIYPANNKAPGKPLQVIEWDGVEQGPYHMLWYQSVPSRVMPSAPMNNLYDLHDLANRMFNKVARQGEAQKSVTAVGPGGDRDAERVIKAADLDTIRTDAPEKLGVLNYGGVNPNSLAFTIQVRELFSMFAGNLDLMAGLGPQSETLGQDQILAASNSRRLAKMQGKVERWIEGILRALMWYEWTDPLRERYMTYKIPQTTREVDLLWTPEDRQGAFLEYNLNVTPHSVRYRSPAERVQLLDQFVMQILIPLMQMGGGYEIDLEQFIRLRSRYLEMDDELAEVVRFSTQQEGESITGQGEARQAPVTRRINERVNRPGATRQGKDDVLTRGLMGIGVQDSEMASVARPLG